MDTSNSGPFFLNLARKFRFAFKGILICWRKGTSFKIQVFATLFASLFLVYIKANTQWSAIFILTCGSVLSAEAVNTALEITLDALHPDEHPVIGFAKDCAAGAVLILSFCSLGIFALCLANHFALFK